MVSIYKMENVQALYSSSFKNQLEKSTKLYFEFAKHTHRYHYCSFYEDVRKTITQKTTNFAHFAQRAFRKESLFVETGVGG